MNAIDTYEDCNFRNHMKVDVDVDRGLRIRNITDFYKKIIMSPHKYKLYSKDDIVILEDNKHITGFQFPKPNNTCVYYFKRDIFGKLYITHKIFLYRDEIIYRNNYRKNGMIKSRLYKHHKKDLNVMVFYDTKGRKIKPIGKKNI
jgi:hypothetical protein